MKKVWLHNKKGASLVEVLLALAILAMFTTAVIGALVYSRESVVVNGARNRALLIAEEGLEAVKSMRDQDYANLVNGTHGLSIDAYHWILSGASDVVGNFTRVIDITEIDSSSKNVTVTITWESFLGRTKTVVLESIISDWRATVSSVPKWQIPRLTISFDLSGTSDGQKIHTVDNYSYITRADGTNDFIIVNVSDDSAPVFSGGLNLSGQPADIYVSGNYAYVASDTNNEELQIIDISDPTSPNQVSQIDAAGTANATAITVSGNYAYVVRDSSNQDELVIIDISDPLNPSIIGTLNLGANAFDVRVSENYAYIASASNSQEIQIVDVSNSASISIDGSINMAGNTNPTTLEVGGDYLYVSRQGKIEIYDKTTPLLPISVLSYNAVGTANDLSIDVIGNFLFLATEGNNNEIEVVDISTPATAVQKSIYNMTGTDDALGLSYEEIKDRLYVVSGRDTEELMILAPF